MVYNWSCITRLQIQTQNEADAAAQLAILPQVTQFNQLSLGLYAANVEEYRLRTLMQSLVLNVQDSAGCDYPSNGRYPTPEQDNVAKPQQTIPRAYNCRLNYPKLRQAYIDSVNRYTADIQMIESIGNISVAEQRKAPVNMIDTLTTKCNNCGTHYMLNAYTSRERVLSLGQLSTDGISYKYDNANQGSHAQPNMIITPGTVDVTVCKEAKGLLPNIFGQTMGPVHVIARSAATPIAVTQEWFEPGLARNAKTHGPYQPQESWAPVNTVDSSGKNWNMVNFSGNTATADSTKQNYSTNISNTAGEFAVYIPWWNSAVVHPIKLTSAEQATLAKSLESAGCQ